VVAGAKNGLCGGTWSQSAPWAIVSEQALPNAPKSADRMDGAMMAGGDMVSGYEVERVVSGMRHGAEGDGRGANGREG
jgi:hypothetical protein